MLLGTGLLMIFVLWFGAWLLVGAMAVLSLLLLASFAKWSPTLGGLAAFFSCVAVFSVVARWKGTELLRSSSPVALRFLGCALGLATIIGAAVSPVVFAAPARGMTDSATGSSRKGYEQVPFAMLSPDDGEGGVAAICYFPVEERSDVARLRRGETVSLNGVFSSYRRAGDLPTIVLEHCSLAD